MIFFASAKPALALTLASFLVLALLLRARGSPVITRLPARAPDTSLGDVDTGVHTHVLGVAAFDFALTLLAAGAFAWISCGGFVVWTILLLATGEVMHAVYAVPTPTYRWLFG